MYSLSLLLFGLVIFLQLYLKGDLKILGLSSNVSKYYEKDIQDRLKENKGASLEISMEEREALFKNLKSNLGSDLSQNILTEIESKYSKEIVEKSRLSEIKNQFEVTKVRLNSEIEALSRRGNLNLIIGIITTLIAIGLLAYIVLNSNIKFIEYSELISHYVPRLSLIIFIEVFSFFFLKLYKNSLEGIKYFQNEMTNVEIKFISLESVFLSGDDEAIKTISQELSKTERNYIISQNESTVELEKIKQDNQQIKNILDSVLSIIKKTK